MFTLYFIVAVLGTSFICGVAHFSIQREQWIDLIFKWQDMLYRIGEKKGVIYTILYKALGGCTYCFCHLISLFSFFGFAGILMLRGDWFTMPNLWSTILANIGVYLVFISSATSLGFIHVTKWMVSNDKG